MIGGGGTIYAASLAFADILNLTEVDAAPIGDAYFPVFDAASFYVTFREDHAAGPHDDHPFSFVDYRRADGE
jgi:dihydrofolate reductase